MPAKPKELFPVRIFILSSAFLVWSVLLIARFVDLQIFQYADLSSKAERQQNRSFEISPQRGTIYDRRGRELAVSVNVDSVYAVSSDIADKKQAADQLAQALGLKRQLIFSKLNSTRGFLWLKRKIDYSEASRVKALGLKGVYFEKESKRFYPNRELAAHVLGYVGMDDNGLSGLEFAYQKKIGGLPGRMSLCSDARQRSFNRIEKAPEPGEDLILTIDQTLQYIAEQELTAQVKTSNALGGTVIVMDPQSGEILAMASYPAFNPNYYSNYLTVH